MAAPQACRVAASCSPPQRWRAGQRWRACIRSPWPGGGRCPAVASDGGIFPFGTAGGHGSVGGQRLPAPVVGMTAA